MAKIEIDSKSGNTYDDCYISIDGVMRPDIISMDIHMVAGEDITATITVFVDDIKFSGNNILHVVREKK